MLSQPTGPVNYLSTFHSKLMNLKPSERKSKDRVAHDEKKQPEKHSEPNNDSPPKMPTTRKVIKALKFIKDLVRFIRSLIRWIDPEDQ